MKRKVMIFSIFIIFLFSIVAVSAMDDTNGTVVNDEDILLIDEPETVYNESLNENEGDSILAENEGDVILAENENSTHFGYWAWSTDVKTTNFTDLANHGVTDYILNFYAFHRYNESVVKSLAATAKENGINLHIWAQIFNDGDGWIRPIDRAGNVNYEYFDKKTAELEYYAGVEGVAGIHYDYLRFAGSEKYNNTAWQNPGGMEAITYFVKQSTEAIRKVNPNLTISAAIMPEMDSLARIYGVDYPEITKYFDVITPMIYRGNYDEDTEWVARTTESFIENSSGSIIWTGLQAYTDDDHMDSLLPVVEMNTDIKTALDAGAKGVMIFKINCSKNLDFNNLTVDESQYTSFEYLNYKTSSTYNHLDLENDFVFNETTDMDFTDGANVFYKNLTINGNNHSIDAKNLARFMNIYRDDVVLMNIQFKNSLNGRNPAIYVNGKNFKLVNCSFDSDLNVFTSNFTKYYGSPKRFYVYVVDADSNPISNKTVDITVNGVTYTKTTDENGSASLGINLNTGAYEIATCVDNQTVYSTVTILSTIDGEDITKVFRNDTQYYATFIDIYGDELDSENVTFNINGVMYNRSCDEEGIAKLNINLPQGEYVITAINPISGEMHTNTITVLPSIAENADLTKYYKNDSQYVVRIIGADGNPAGPGENVTFNINGVFYNRTTNESGHVKLNINLNPGEYIITADYKGCMVSNNITVLTTVETKDMSMNYKDGSAFEAKILDGEGKSYPNQNVQFNINGVLYDEITDENGVAKLNINLMPGVYIITSSYNGYGAGNKITIGSNPARS